MNTYPLTQTNKDQEQTLIKEILKKNGYQQSMIYHKHKNKTHKNHIQGTQEIEKKNWQHLHTLAPKSEPLLTYFDIQISKSHSKPPTQ
jgi:hypothetical protein